MLRPAGPGGPPFVVGRGRDLHTDRAGRATPLAEVTIEVRIAPDGVVTAISATPANGSLQRLVGFSGTVGFRRQLAEAGIVPGPLLHAIVHELPVALLLATASQAGADGSVPTTAVRPPLLDVCAGWISDGWLATHADERERGARPVAPSLDDDGDPVAWHAMPDLPPGSVRRIRRMDLCDDGRPETLGVDAMFRDVLVPPAGEAVILHEYGLAACMTRAGVLTAVEPTPHVLPGPECPNAVASAERLVGSTVDEVRTVAAGLRGTATCTHLNDALRALADLGHLHGVLCSVTTA